jgi:hypothetical protein
MQFVSFGINFRIKSYRMLKTHDTTMTYSAKSNVRVVGSTIARNNRESNDGRVFSCCLLMRTKRGEPLMNTGAVEVVSISLNLQNSMRLVS